ncbi:Histone acetyltransferase HPA2 [Pantoea sp. AS-PWVM4]|uniref:GNAT family N-acetyltransferase n=1 Tax=Pantoea sp. AS-PWVM4 TaxID=1332069 RepID=UPI0003AC6952|nr:GNAT family N-acetyltransferase [Pantoea sp. AS-PWVM4]ERK17571.1 Histone acetyltransferase HPA2 [Pantoea sp. AS-PWVM4]
MEIRALSFDDRSAWQKLWKGYQRFYAASISDVATEQTFRRFMADSQPMYCLVAEENGKLIGLVHYLTHRTTWTVGDYCYLQDLFVSEAARGKGVGKALILAVYQQAEALGCSRVYWTTQESNATARKLYDQIASKTEFIQYRKLLGA